MTVTNGKTYKEFYNDSDFWPQTATVEDELLLVNGQDWGWEPIEDIPDTAHVAVTGGFVDSEDKSWLGNGLELGELFRIWQAAQDTRTVVVTVPGDKYWEFQQLVRKFGAVIGD